MQDLWSEGRAERRRAAEPLAERVEIARRPDERRRAIEAASAARDAPP
jgi:hypothetical protein